MSIPSAIGRYEIVARLATGGMAELFLARERGYGGLERLVVIKKLFAHLAADRSYVEMFLREARIAAQLQHPNVIEIFDLGRDAGDYFIVMEYIEGSTARELQVLATNQGFYVDTTVAIAIAIQALKGLGAAHELTDLNGQTTELIHRDISPHNIMCTRRGHVKLLDFGVAKATSGSEATHSGNLKGKYAYMSPEQCKRRDLDPRTDIFSMGTVLWELCSGRRLFKRESELDTMDAIVSGDIPAVNAIDRDLEQILSYALAVDRDRRFQTARAFQVALQDYARHRKLDVSEEVVADFVRRVAGAQLGRRANTLADALKRSLTSREAETLLHVRDNRLAHESPDDPDASGETVLSKHKSSATLQTETRYERKRRPNRTFLLLGALVLIVGIIIGTLFTIRLFAPSDPEAAVLLGEPIPIAWAPTADPEVLRQELAPFREYLERSIRRPTPIEITSSYHESSKKLRSGEVAFALLPPLLYVRTKEKSPGVELLGMKVYQGSKRSDGLLLVRSDDKIKTLDEIEGKKFCFPDRDSTTGYFLPRAYLRSQGKDLETFIGEVVWTRDHVQSLRDLISGKCDVAATYSGAMFSSFALDIPVAQLQTLAVTGSVPQDVIVAGPNTTRSDKEAMTRALREFGPNRESGGGTLGDVVQVSGFLPVSDADFDELRKLLKESEGSL